ncbi:MAG: radical SAM protein [Opitutaceae bacterium]|nr:radical SAM protein [Opitutaceae bacterium]
MEFRDFGSPAPLLQHVDQSNADAFLPLSLYFHLPFCETLCWFCGCTTVITLNHQSSDTYLDYLEKEVALLAPRVHADRRVVQLHYGGGTPTFFQPPQLARLAAITRRHFRFSPEAEHCVEIDPRRFSHAQIAALREGGFTRASLGEQDFDPQVQLAVHRIQPRAMTEQAIARLRDEGFTSINLDLIYGLPHQTVDTFRDTLEQVLEPPGPLRRFQLCARVLDETRPEIFRARIRAALARGQARDAQAHHRDAHEPGLRLHRHGPLCPRDR